MEAASVQALGYIELGASDLAAWRDYAQGVLGVECIQSGEALDLRYDDACWRVRVVPTGEDDVRCAGFEVGSAQHLQSIRSRLEGQGVGIRAGTQAEAAGRQVDELLVCEDPGGLRIELYVGDRAGSAAFASPRHVAGFVTERQGLGHMVITVDGEGAAESFYREGLGFRLSDHIVLGPPDRQLTLTFLHCNPRHHTLALVPVPGKRRLNHIMLQVASFDDVGRGLDAALDAGVRISSSLGRHTNDRMISFYMQTPSGFDIEYGFGGVEIDDSVWRPETHHATSLWGHRRGLN